MKAFNYKEIDSSQDEVKRLILSGEREFFILADSQTKGRGTQGRKWISDSGSGLYFSFALGLKENLYSDSDLTEYCTKITKEAVIVLQDALMEYCLCPALEAVYIKPINDLYYDSQKLAGILVEHMVFNEESFLIIGLGLNLKPISSDGSFSPVSLEEICGSGLSFDREAFSRSFALKLASTLNKISI